MLSKVIRDCPNYLVYRDGRIQNHVSGRFLKPSISSTNGGYFIVSLRARGKYNTMTVHRLVGEAFIAGWTPKRCTINHKNGDKLDNRACNLEWVTHQENMRHAQKLKLFNLGEMASTAKLTVAQAVAIYTRVRSGESAGVLAREFSVARSTVLRIKHRQAWWDTISHLVTA